MDALAQEAKIHPEAYERERAVRFGMSPAGIQLALKRLGITHQKRPRTPPKADPARRLPFQHMIKAHEP